MSDIKAGQIEKLLQELMEMKDKLTNAKALLKNFKVTSDDLTKLMKAKKELAEQIADEKDRIEDDFYADKDYEQSKNDELTLKNQIREKSAELKQLMAKVDTDQQLSTYNYNIKGEDLKMQVEKVVKVYINGKEER